MAVKAITIDMAAYTLLARRKESGQSFSQVIKQHFGPQPTAGRFATLVRAIHVSEAAIDAMDRQVANRRKDMARAVKR